MLFLKLISRPKVQFRKLEFQDANIVWGGGGGGGRPYIHSIRLVFQRHSLFLYIYILYTEGFFMLRWAFSFTKRNYHFAHLCFCNYCPENFKYIKFYKYIVTFQTLLKFIKILFTSPPFSFTNCLEDASPLPPSFTQTFSLSLSLCHS